MYDEEEAAPDKDVLQTVSCELEREHEEQQPLEDHLFHEGRPIISGPGYAQGIPPEHLIREQLSRKPVDNSM